MSDQTRIGMRFLDGTLKNPVDAEVPVRHGEKKTVLLSETVALASSHASIVYLVGPGSPRLPCIADAKKMEQLLDDAHEQLSRNGPVLYLYGGDTYDRERTTVASAAAYLHRRHRAKILMVLADAFAKYATPNNYPFVDAVLVYKAPRDPETNEVVFGVVPGHRGPVGATRLSFGCGDGRGSDSGIGSSESCPSPVLYPTHVLALGGRKTSVAECELAFKCGVPVWVLGLSLEENEPDLVQNWAAKKKMEAAKARQVPPVPCESSPPSDDISVFHLPTTPTLSHEQATVAAAAIFACSVGLLLVYGLARSHK